MAATAVDQRPPVDGDLVRSYLRDIGRVPLLSHEQEITLGRQVQELVRLEEAEAEFKMRQGHEPSREEWRQLGHFPGVASPLINGRQAQERMAANLRLVVSVAKNTKRNVLDLIQEAPLVWSALRSSIPLAATSSPPTPIGGFVRHHPRHRRESHHSVADPHH